jgi:hypothetical protein
MHSVPAGGRWTVHGIWPSTDHGHGPFDCNKTLPFDPAAIEPIKQVFNSFSLLSCLKSYRPIEIDKLTSKKPNACRAD